MSRGRGGWVRFVANLPTKPNSIKGSRVERLARRRPWSVRVGNGLGQSFLYFTVSALVVPDATDIRLCVAKEVADWDGAEIKSDGELVVGSN